MLNHLSIYTDGGARGNPGPAASAFVIYQQNEEIDNGGKYLGEATNNVAEYSAVVLAYQWLDKHKSDITIPVDFFLDSQLVVSQLNGVYKIKDKKLLQLYSIIKSDEFRLKIVVRYNLIPREKNKKADMYVNKILDENLY